MRTMRAAWSGTETEQAAHRHVGVAHRLNLLDAELVGGLVEAGEETVQQSDDPGRRHLRRQGREAHDVGKGYCDFGEPVGDALLAAAQAVGDRRREHIQQQLLGLTILVLDDDVFLVQFVDHAVEGRTELADLIARAHWNLRRVVASGESAHAGRELAQGPHQRTRQPGAGRRSPPTAQPLRR